MLRILLNRFTALVVLSAVGVSASAQMVGSSVFLKGKYVEAGICTYGDFGASSAPAGYHPHPSTAPLGFVADPDMDGWTTGTPAYKGDFFTPGMPFEGWEIQIGSISNRASAQSCASFGGAPGLSGANTAYATSGSKVIGTWEGAFDSVNIKQETTLDTLGLYFTMRVTLTNMSSVAKNNIYYMRSVDPDNDESWPGGSFTTKNKIEYQLPNAANAVVVSAKGTVDTSSYLSLGTADSFAKCLIYNSWPIPATTDLSTVYGGSLGGSSYAVGSVVTSDVAIGLCFYINHIAPLDSASDSVAYKTTNAVKHHMHPANQRTFTYFYAFRRDAVDSAIKQLVDTGSVAADTSHPTTAIVNANQNPEVKIYPNPAKDIVNVTGLQPGDRIELYDMTGRTINQDWDVNRQGINTYPLGNLTKGTYLLLIKDDKGNLKARERLNKL